jgi:hypothetical protein
MGKMKKSQQKRGPSATRIARPLVINANTVVRELVSLDYNLSTGASGRVTTAMPYTPSTSYSDYSQLQLMWDQFRVVSAVLTLSGVGYIGTGQHGMIVVCFDHDDTSYTAISSLTNALAYRKKYIVSSNQLDRVVRLRFSYPPTTQGAGDLWYDTSSGGSSGTVSPGCIKCFSTSMLGNTQYLTGFLTLTLDLRGRR